MTDGYIIANNTPIVKVLYLLQWLTVYRGASGDGFNLQVFAFAIE